MLSFTQTDIQYWCGSKSSQRGYSYYQANRVQRVQYDSDEETYSAIVNGSKPYNVEVTVYDDDISSINAQCDCPFFETSFDYCKHVAAVLFYILYSGGDIEVIRNETRKVSPEQKPQESVLTSHRRQLAARVLDLVVSKATGNQAVEAKAKDASRSELLLMESVCHIHEGFQSSSYISLELKLGVKRTYKVQKVREFLDNVSGGRSQTFSKNFTYSPQTQYFSPTDEAIIQQLLSIRQMERLYHTSMYGYSTTTYARNDKTLMIPAALWSDLFELLKQGKTWLYHKGQITPLLGVVPGKLPVPFEVDKVDEDILCVDLKPLSEITVLRDYGYAVMNGGLYTLPEEQLDILENLTSIFKYESEYKVYLPPNQVSAFMEQVAPVLGDMGRVQMDERAMEDFVSHPLAAKMYLDIVDNHLMLELVFEYGDTAIHPFSPDVDSSGEIKDKLGRTVLRDRRTEERILGHVRTLDLKIVGKRAFLTDDDSIYEFLYDVLPEIESSVDVFATNSVDAVSGKMGARPKTSIDVRDNQYLDIRFDIDGIDEAEVQSVLSAIVERRRYHRLKNGKFVSLADNDFDSIRHLMEDMHVRTASVKNGRASVRLTEGLHLLPGYEGSSQIKLGRRARSLMDDLLHPDNLEFPVPESLSSTLRDYQKYGYQWMKTLAHYGFGGVLADDMGLGKTIQSIAFIVSELGDIRESGKSVLIVSPASLIYNWQSEIAKFAPDVVSVVVAGVGSDRERMIQAKDAPDVYITSYPLLRIDVDLYKDKDFHAIILDEAQAIKNHATQTAQAAVELHSDRRFALTGTPIENSLDDLWSIFHFVFPSMFPNHKAFSTLAPDGVAKRIRPFVLRRLKKEVLQELPDKIETVQQSELTEDQKKLYLAYLERIQHETTVSLEQEGFQKSRMKILAGLTRLRQLCCHPGLFVENYGGSSGKLEQLLEVLDECKSSGRRVLVFSQFTEMLGIILKSLERAGIDTFYLDGSTPVKERLGLCERFNRGECDVFLISLKAGGTGLNLTGADTVILFDLWWNPAVEDQAADRAHRIGQKNVVQVIRLVANGTIEERIYELQQKKKNLIDEVVGDGEASLSALSEEEIRELLMLA